MKKQEVLLDRYYIEIDGKTVTIFKVNSIDSETRGTLVIGAKYVRWYRDNSALTYEDSVIAIKPRLCRAFSPALFECIFDAIKDVRAEVKRIRVLLKQSTDDTEEKPE